ncbi:DUF6415 family natural product biosynthesis protein [Streptomyces sp. NPDC057302]|uniref:DUF6415 family natural product biosynthesis protein n=1 Tax=Streptomyces sp. NPDC057302 TaxID=3346094 RepID=UPI00363E36C9
MSDHSEERNFHGTPETTQLRQLVEQTLAWDLRSPEDVPEVDHTLGVIEGIREQASLLSDVLQAAVERMPQDSDVCRRVQATLSEARGRLTYGAPPERHRAAARAQNLARLGQALLQAVHLVEREAPDSLIPPPRT